MHKFINKILNEAEDINDDPFFKPKDLDKKQRDIIKKNDKAKAFLSKIKIGLHNVKKSYENKRWESEEEELFLEIFSELSFNGYYSNTYEGYSLVNKYGNWRCIFNLRNNIFWFSYKHIGSFFYRKFYWGHNEINSFIEQMFNKYFKLNDFIATIDIAQAI